MNRRNPCYKPTCSVVLALWVLWSVPRGVAAPSQHPIIVLGIQQEIAPLTAILGRPSTLRPSGYKITAGEIGNVPILAAVSGIGKENAAALVAVLIDRYHPRAVIFTGTSGGANPVLEQGDLVIARSTIIHDLGALTGSGFTHWATENPLTGKPNPRYFEADPLLWGAAMDAVCHVDFQPLRLDSGPHTPRILTGIIASGDMFIANKEKVAELRRELHADAVEMEGAAVAQVCFQQKVPCIIIRSVSDRADGNAPKDYPRFIRAASQNSAAFAAGLVRAFDRAERQEAWEKSDTAKKPWHLDFELPWGEGSPYSKTFPDITKLSYLQQLNLTRFVLGRIVSLASRDAGIGTAYLSIGPGASAGTPIHPCARLDVTCNGMQIANLSLILGYLCEQTEVIATAESLSGDTPAIDIQSPAFTQTATLARFWSSLQKQSPTLAEGFMPLSASAIRILDIDQQWSRSDDPAFEHAIRAAARETGVPVTIRWGREDLDDICNPWTLLPDGQRCLSRLRGPQAPALRKRLAGEDRVLVTGWITQALTPPYPHTPTVKYLGTPVRHS